jgi:hypothetical protein
MRLGSPELTYMGRPGLVEGTRELLEWPYIIVYKVYDERDIRVWLCRSPYIELLMRLLAETGVGDQWPHGFGGGAV